VVQRDSYRSTGCFDLTCSGFVQTGQVVLGGAVNPISSRWGKQYAINVGMFLVKECWNYYYDYVRNDGKRLRWCL